MAMMAVIITFNKAKPGFLHTGRERESTLWSCISSSVLNYTSTGALLLVEK